MVDSILKNVYIIILMFVSVLFYKVGEDSNLVLEIFWYDKPHINTYSL
jgi:hypothetical protein